MQNIRTCKHYSRVKQQKQQHSEQREQRLSRFHYDCAIFHHFFSLYIDHDERYFTNEFRKFPLNLVRLKSQTTVKKLVGELAIPQNYSNANVKNLSKN